MECGRRWRRGHFRYEPPLIASSIAIGWFVVWWEEQELIHSVTSSIYFSLLFCNLKSRFPSFSCSRLVCGLWSKCSTTKKGTYYRRNWFISSFFEPHLSSWLLICISHRVLYWAIEQPAGQRRGTRRYGQCDMTDTLILPSLSVRLPIVCRHEILLLLGRS